MRTAAGWPRDLQLCKLPAHTNAYYGDRNKIKMIVIALTLSQIKMNTLNDGKAMFSNTIQSMLDTILSTRMDT